MFRQATAKTIGLLVCGLVACTAVAQDRSQTKAYAEGVHAYFAGDYSQAVQWLSQAVQRDATDPRAFYFLGSARYALGDVDQAKQDFQKGAEAEVFGPPLPYALNKVLERVQGPARVAIEQAREAAARKKAAVDLARKRLRYEALQRAERLVLYPPKPLPGAVQLIEQVKMISLEHDPFQADLLFAAGKPAPDDAQKQLLASPIPKPSAKPAAGAEGAAPTTTPAATDPFGAPLKPAKKSTKPESKKTDDPFADPFGN